MREFPVTGGLPGAWFEPGLARSSGSGLRPRGRGSPVSGRVGSGFFILTGFIMRMALLKIKVAWQIADNPEYRS
jgi:hypothetical protein